MVPKGLRPIIRGNDDKNKLGRFSTWLTVLENAKSVQTTVKSSNFFIVMYLALIQIAATR